LKPAEENKKAGKAGRDLLAHPALPARYVTVRRAITRGP
jgi:hypothetical protein